MLRPCVAVLALVLFIATMCCCRGVLTTGLAETETYPHLFYLNLANRTDRKERLLRELAKVHYPQERIHRIDAIRKKNGALGCGLSHIKALEQIQDMNLKQAIILEDDFMWKISPEEVRAILQEALGQSYWQICLLACNGSISEPHRHLGKVDVCQTTSGYIVRRAYVQSLLDNYRATVTRPENTDTHNAAYLPENHIDQSWKQLQSLDSRVWVATHPLLGKQGDSYSDIMKQHVSYNV
jgi:glycosyl transferase, family 25